MIVKTDAIVLRSRKFRETSKILNFYTKEFGRISVIAKGARGPKSRFGSSLQPLNHVSAVVYKNDNRELHLLSQCDYVTRFTRLAEDLDKFTAAMSVVEMVEYVAHDEEQNHRLFDLSLAVLNAINDADRNALNVQLYFELQLTDVLGFRPNFHECLSCTMPLNDEHVGTNGSELRFGNGGVLCGRCSAKGNAHTSISPGALRILQRFQETSSPDGATAVRLTADQTDEVRRTLRHYLQSHVGGLHRLKAQYVSASIV